MIYLRIDRLQVEIPVPKESDPNGAAKDIVAIRRGQHPPGGDLQVVDGRPAGGPVPVLPQVTEQFAPEYHPEEISYVAKRIMQG